MQPQWPVVICADIVGNLVCFSVFLNKSTRTNFAFFLLFFLFCALQMECLLIFIVPSLQNICSHTAYTHVNTVAQMTGAVVWTEHLVHAYIYIGVGGENVNVKPFLLLAVCHPPHTLHFPNH